MKRIILFVSLLLLTYVNSNAGNNMGGEPSALTADFSASVTSGCAPLAVQFASTSTFNAGDPIVSYTWNFGDGVTITTANANPSHTYSAVGAFSVTLTITSQGGGTHTTTKSSYITTFEKPVFSMGNDTSLCADGGQLYFSLPTGYDAYSWSQGTATTPFGWLNYYPGLNILWAQVTNGTCIVRDTMLVTTLPEITGKFGYQILSTCGAVVVQFTDSSISCDDVNPANYWEWVMDGDYVDGFYDQTNPVHTFATGGTHTVYYTVMNDNGVVKEIDSTITLPNPTPGPAPVDLGPDKNICVGGSIQFDAGSEPGATYVWTPGTGLSSTSVYNPVASPSVATTYTVTKTKCGIDAAPASVTVNVNPPVVVNLGPDQSMCPGGSLTLDAGITGATYQWGSTYSPVYTTMTGKTVVALGAGSYWVTVTKNGCVAKDTIVITAKPAVDPLFTYTQTGVCGTLSVNFTDASIPCSGSISNYVWDFGDGSPAISGDNPTISHNYSIAGTYHVILTVTTSGGVSDSYEQDIIVTGGTPPTVNLGADAAICSGSSITLDAGNPGAGTTYNWSNGATTQTISVSTPGTYTVTVTRNGCSASDSKDITLTTPPTVNLGADAAICAGNNITLDAGAHGAGTTYNWSNGATTQTITVSPASNTTYTVNVTRNSCTGTDAKLITVNTAPIVDLGADAAICAGSSIILDAGDPGAGTTYSWSPGGATTRTISVSTADTYTVTVARNGCSASDSKVIKIGRAHV